MARPAPPPPPPTGKTEKPEHSIMLQVEDKPLEEVVGKSALAEKWLLLRAGDLDIPIEPSETAQQALLRWADGPGRARLRLKLRRDAEEAEA